jgi:hypothetical protein
MNNEITNEEARHALGKNLMDTLNRGYTIKRLSANAAPFEPMSAATATAEPKELKAKSRSWYPSYRNATVKGSKRSSIAKRKASRKQKQRK